jgi:alkanesulfonate monooxygenase SsuD/methylene tetrahydromethanopterin reductase-like flavin-dependent oxidoreductase (luciferase family)
MVQFIVLCENQQGFPLVKAEVTMDILHLVDRLEELFNKSHAIPLTHSVIVDEDKFLDIIDQMRISIPEEVKKAQDVFTKKDRVMAQAQEEANRTLQLARDRADGMIGKETLVSDAKRRAEQIIEQARVEGENVKAAADRYAQESLINMEQAMEQLLTQVRNGIQVLEQRHPPSDDPKS